jgi:hypothetical protein
MPKGLFDGYLLYIISLTKDHGRTANGRQRVVGEIIA